MTRPCVILTHSGDTAAYEDVLRARGVEPLVEPMLTITPSSAPLPALSSYEALAFTSMHAVDICAPRLTDFSLPVYTVGDTTAARAREAGFTDVRSASGTATDLDRLIQESGQRVLHLCGAQIARPLTGVDTFIVYTAEKVAGFTAVTQNRIADGTVSAVVFFSPRGGENFVRLIRREGQESAVSGIKALCISPAVLESVSVLPWQETRIAARPDRSAMLALLEA